MKIFALPISVRTSTPTDLEVTTDVNESSSTIYAELILFSGPTDRFPNTTSVVLGTSLWTCRSCNVSRIQKLCPQRKRTRESYRVPRKVSKCITELPLTVTFSTGKDVFRDANSRVAFQKKSQSGFRNYTSVTFLVASDRRRGVLKGSWTGPSSFFKRSGPTKLPN